MELLRNLTSQSHSWGGVVFPGQYLCTTALLLCEWPVEREIMILSWPQSSCSSTQAEGEHGREFTAPFLGSLPRLMHLCCKHPQNWSLPQLRCSLCNSVRVYCTFNTLFQLHIRDRFLLSCLELVVGSVPCFTEVLMSIFFNTFDWVLHSWNVAELLIPFFSSRKIDQNK